MSEPEAPIRGLGWRGRWIKREPLILAVVLLVIVALGVINVIGGGEHSRTGANAIGGPVSAVGGDKR